MRSASSPRRRRPSSPGPSSASTAAGRSGDRPMKAVVIEAPGAEAAVRGRARPDAGAERRRRRRARVRHLRHRPAHPRGGPADGELSADPGPRAVGRGRRGRPGGDARPRRRPRRRRSLAPLRRLRRVSARPRQPLPALGRDRRHAARRLGRSRARARAQRLCAARGVSARLRFADRAGRLRGAGAEAPRGGAGPLVPDRRRRHDGDPARHLARARRLRAGDGGRGEPGAPVVRARSDGPEPDRPRRARGADRRLRDRRDGRAVGDRGRDRPGGPGRHVHGLRRRLARRPRLPCRRSRSTSGRSPWSGRWRSCAPSSPRSSWSRRTPTGSGRC